ncbi:hypothetical protein AAFN90_01230 [Erwiniaceae bacterium CAU 1747]
MNRFTPMRKAELVVNAALASAGKLHTFLNIIKMSPAIRHCNSATCKICYAEKMRSVAQSEASILAAGTHRLPYRIFFCVYLTLLIFTSKAQRCGLEGSVQAFPALCFYFYYASVFVKKDIEVIP